MNMDHMNQRLIFYKSR